MKTKIDSYQTKIQICPYCGCGLEISCFSTQSIRHAICDTIELLEEHTKRCKKVSSKRFVNVSIQTKSKSEYSIHDFYVTTSFNTHKILI